MSICKVNISKAVLRDALEVKKATIVRAMRKEANLTIAQIREQELAELTTAIESITEAKG